MTNGKASKQFKIGVTIPNVNETPYFLDKLTQCYPGSKENPYSKAFRDYTTEDMDESLNLFDKISKEYDKENNSLKFSLDLKIGENMKPDHSLKDKVRLEFTLITESNESASDFTEKFSKLCSSFLNVEPDTIKVDAKVRSLSFTDVKGNLSRKAEKKETWSPRLHCY